MSDPKTEKLFRKAVSAVKAKKGRGLVFGSSRPKMQGPWNTYYEVGPIENVQSMRSFFNTKKEAVAKAGALSLSTKGYVTVERNGIEVESCYDGQLVPKRSSRKRRTLGYQPYRSELANLVDSLGWGPTLAPVGAARAKQILAAAHLPNVKLPRPGQEILVDKYKDSDPWSREPVISLYLENNAGHYRLKVLGGQIDDYLEPKQVSSLIRERMTTSA